MSMQSKPSCVTTVFHTINSLLVLVMLGVIIALLAFGFNPFGVADTIFPSGRILYWWAYSYEIQNYESSCPVSREMAIQVATCSMTATCGEADPILIRVQDCRRETLNRYLDRMGNDGWELVSLETMLDQSLMGIERAYRLTWKKSMSSIR